MKKHQKYLLVLVLFVFALMPRFFSLKQAFTVDEPNWMIRSQTYYIAFREGRLDATMLSSHPGITTNILAGASIEAKKLWIKAKTGIYKDIEREDYFKFIKVARLPIVITVALSIALSFFFLSRLINKNLAFWATLLIALDPFFIAYSRLVHVDALLTSFMYLAILTLLLFFKKNKKRYLVYSGIFSGLAFLTKIPSIFLIPLFGLLVLFSYKKSILKWSKFRKAVSDFILWTLIALLIFILLWPAVWVKFSEVKRYAEHDYHAALAEQRYETDEGEQRITKASNVIFYLKALINNTTFYSLPFFILALMFAFIYKDFRKKNFWIYLLIIFFFVLMMSLGNRRGDRYLLPLVPFIIILATRAFFSIFRIFRNVPQVIRVGVLVCLIIVQAFCLVRLHPYYLSYYNFIVPYAKAKPLGWGEGLELAAEYLNQKPHVNELYVASWYPEILDTYFNGHTMHLNSRTQDRIGYVVVYKNMFGRGEDYYATKVIREYYDKKVPEKTIEVNGIPYAWIFKKKTAYEFPEIVGEIQGETKVGQSLRAQFNGLTEAGVLMSNYSSRENTEDIIFSLKYAPQDKETLRKVTVNAKEVQDGEWHKFTFEPIYDSKDKDFYFEIESPKSFPGNAITCRFQEPGAYENGAMHLFRKELKKNESADQFKREADLGFWLGYEKDRKILEQDDIKLIR